MRQSEAPDRKVHGERLVFYEAKLHVSLKSASTVASLNEARPVRRRREGETVARARTRNFHARIGGGDGRGG